MKTTLQIFRFMSFCLCGLLALPAYAQKKEMIKTIISPRYCGVQIPQLFDRPIGSLKYNPNNIAQKMIDEIRHSGTFSNAKGIRINPKGKKHSIAPSSTSVLGSEKIPSSGWGNTPVKKNSSTRIPASERPLWKRTWNKVASLAYYKPCAPEELKPYLRHSVPKETLSYIQQRYSDLVSKIQKATERVIPIVVYASLPEEGARPRLEEVSEFSEMIYPIILQINELRTALPNEPFLKKQQEAWEQVFTMFNPLLACLVISPAEACTRADRTFDFKEFHLYNPDGTDYILPKSDTLLKDEDELEEMESYAAVREKMRNPPIKPEDAEKERALLLDKLPSGMRIALINDDLLPRINFEGWAKKGYLGHNATLETFQNGNDFMTQIRNGGRYDLVITDLVVVFGGLTMMPELRSLDENVIVIVSSKNDRGEDTNKMFNLGADGYMWYTSNLNEGAYGYIEYLRAMKNYFYYKQKHNWRR